MASVSPDFLSAGPGSDRRATRDPEDRLLPGSPGATERGCCCSVLANVSYRFGGDTAPLLDPECPVHAPHPSDREAGSGRSDHGR